MPVVIVVSQPRGKRWRKVLQRLGGDPRLGIVLSSDEGLARAASFVVERMGGSTLLLSEGECLSLLTMSVSNVSAFLRDTVYRCVKRLGLVIDSRLLNLGLALVLFPKPGEASRFIELNKVALTKCCSEKRVSNVKPVRLVDFERIEVLALRFARGWGSRILERVGIEIDEYVEAWRNALAKCREFTRV